MAFGHFFKDIPYFRRLALDHLFGRTDRMDIAEFLQTPDDKRFKQDQGHLLGQTALVEFKFRPDHDDGTARIIDPLAEEVLTETAALAFEHVAERFQSAIAGAGDSATMAAIVEERIYRLLQHS